MTTSRTHTSIGVVVGRFQVPELHAGHRHLIDIVAARHDTLVVCIGVSEAYPNDRDPLSYSAREAMVKQAYPHAWVRPVFDHPSDETWSCALDAQLALMFPHGRVVLYGSRDSFLRVYSGTLETRELPSVPLISGTDIRRRLSGQPIHTEEFRAGIMYRELERAPVSYPTVDVAVLKDDGALVLLGGKTRDQGKLRFVGGFVDVGDESLEHAARRELHEEAPGIKADTFRYVGSFRSTDRRYRDTKDGIMTTLFRATYISGHTRAGDDLDTLEWVPTETVLHRLVSEHHPLGTALLDSLGITTSPHH